jgi:hypothetical protein
LSYHRQIVFLAIAIVCPFPFEANSGPVSHALGGGSQSASTVHHEHRTQSCHLTFRQQHLKDCSGIRLPLLRPDAGQ